MSDYEPWAETGETELGYWKRRYLEMSAATERLQEYIPHFRHSCPELHCARTGLHLEDCEDEYCMEQGCEMQDCTCGRQAHIDAAMSVQVLTETTDAD